MAYSYTHVDAIFGFALDLFGGIRIFVLPLKMESAMTVSIQGYPMIEKFSAHAEGLDPSAKTIEMPMGLGGEYIVFQRSYRFRHAGVVNIAYVNHIRQIAIYVIVD